MAKLESYVKQLMGGNDAPKPAHTTDKRFYQERRGVVATKNGSLDFRRSQEGAEWPMATHLTMAYTPINSKEPTPPERGTAPYQATMGKMNNSFDRND